MSIVIFIVILLVLVLAHELGHFLTAKGFGVRVDEFGFGFPPKIVGKKIGETEYSINALPFGGFVKIYGEDATEIEEADMLESGLMDKNKNLATEPPSKDLSRNLAAKPRWQQALVMFAGIFANFLIAWFLIAGLYMAGTNIVFDETLPAKDMQNTHLVIAAVSPGTPAEAAKLEAGDVITGLSYTDQSGSLLSNTPDRLTTFIRGSGGKPIDFNIFRNGTAMTVQVTPANQNGNFVVGISPALEGYIKLPFFRAAGMGFHSSIVLVKETAQGIGGLLAGKESLNDVSGPVGMVSIVGSAVKMGLEYVIIFMALISVNLAVINLIPFPALDGGRLFFLLIEKIKGSRINPKVANILNTVGFGLLIILMLVVTFHDILKLFVK